MLRRIPKRTDSVTLSGYRFEVMDVDSHKIDQVMVTRHHAGRDVPEGEGALATPDAHIDASNKAR
jgi:Mg2+/Co2+ transporter CorC